jgi:hypothetical protein
MVAVVVVVALVSQVYQLLVVAELAAVVLEQVLQLTATLAQQTPVVAVVQVDGTRIVALASAAMAALAQPQEQLGLFLLEVEQLGFLVLDTLLERLMMAVVLLRHQEGQELVDHQLMQTAQVVLLQLVAVQLLAHPLSALLYCLLVLMEVFLIAPKLDPPVVHLEIQVGLWFKAILEGF